MAYIKDNIEVIAVLCTIILAFIGYFISYFNTLRIDKKKARLDFINMQLNEFYGPLYVVILTSDIAFKALRYSAERKGLKHVNEDAPKSKNDLSQWEIWLRNVFVPLNDILEKIIIEKSFLIIENEMPDCLKMFIVHNAGYKALLKNWDKNNFEESISIVDYPPDILEYATNSYNKLKIKQKKLIGKT